MTCIVYRSQVEVRAPELVRIQRRIPISRRAALTGAASLPLLGNSAWQSRGLPASREARAVFAHYMVCCPTAGEHATELDFAAEIQQAQSHGLDGFVLNCGSWDREPRYHTYGTKIFAAAATLGTNFKLLFSADRLSVDETVTMVTEFYDHPNMYRFRGRPMLSTFGGDDEWAKALLKSLEDMGKPIVFVPFFFPKGFDKRLTDANVAQLIADNGYVDGFFYFGAGGPGDAIARTSERIGEAWSRAGKLYMAPVSPYYRGLGPRNYRVFETRGFEGMAAQWKAAIDTGAQWAEIVTWNDWGESTYVASFGPPGATNLWGRHWGPLLSHEAYLAASAYFIRWFKTGIQRIERDDLFWFYRLASRMEPGRSLPDNATTSFPAGSDRLEDHVFVTVFLIDAARLKIESGDRTYEFALAAGVHHLNAEFAEGSQRFSLHRHGRAILAGEGAFPISRDNWANFNYLAGHTGPS